MGNPQSFIEISNFSPGIHADRHGYLNPNATAHPNNISTSGFNANGVAAIDGTYGCHADATGALCPLPARHLVSPAGTFGNINATAAYWPTNRAGIWLLDARLVARVVNYDASTVPVTKVFALFGAYYDPAGGGNYRQLVWGVLCDLNGTNWQTVHWNRHDPATALESTHSIPSGNVYTLRHMTGARDADGFLQYDIYHTMNAVGFTIHSNPTAFHDESNYWATGAIPAAETALTNYGATTGLVNYPQSLDPAFVSGNMGIFPDPLHVTLKKTRYVSGGNIIPGFLALSHQGRAVVAAHASRPFSSIGPGGGMSWWCDRIYFSPVYNAALIADVTTPDTVYSPNLYNTAVVGDEDPNTIGTMGSLSASELLMVKHGGGGVLMRGDMDNFEAVALPYIESTYGAYHHGVPTPIGFVYGSKNGVFAWNGGHTSQKLSTQIDGFFWNHAATLGPSDNSEVPYRGNRGRFGYWNPFVVTPNNFLYDTQQQSWWKLDDVAEANTGSPFNVYDVDAMTGDLVAFRALSDPGTSPSWYTYSNEELRSNYGWQSQALLETRDRLYSVENCEVTFSAAAGASGHVIAVVLSGVDSNGNDVASRTMYFNEGVGERLQTIRHDVVGDGMAQGAFVARYITVRVTIGGDVVGPAPKIHSIKVGVTDRNRQPSA